MYVRVRLCVCACGNVCFYAFVRRRVIVTFRMFDYIDHKRHLASIYSGRQSFFFLAKSETSADSLCRASKTLTVELRRRISKAQLRRFRDERDLIDIGTAYFFSLLNPISVFEICEASLRVRSNGTRPLRNKRDLFTFTNGGVAAGEHMFLS